MKFEVSALKDRDLPADTYYLGSKSNRLYISEVSVTYAD